MNQARPHKFAVDIVWAVDVNCTALKDVSSSVCDMLSLRSGKGAFNLNRPNSLNTQSEEALVYLPKAQ